MIDSTVILVGAVFAFAGVVKGVIGLGLPTIAMGLLAMAMPPLQAAAVLVLPSFVTNFWQMCSGPALGVVLKRLWPLMIGICAGTWAGIGLMTGTTSRYGTVVLGASLALYAVVGLTARRMLVPKAWEPALSPVVGAITGVIAAATGVFVIPAVPYLQAIGLEKQELIQALGLSFTVSTLALAVNVGFEGGTQELLTERSLVALALACTGMWFGQILRSWLSQAAFRRWFFTGLLLLGLLLVARSSAWLS